MHKSRLGVVVVDCQEGDFERDIGFWSAALGRPARRSDDPSNQNYVELESPPGEVMVLLQQGWTFDACLVMYHHPSVHLLSRSITNLKHPSTNFTRTQ